MRSSFGEGAGASESRSDAVRALVLSSSELRLVDVLLPPHKSKRNDIDTTLFARLGVLEGRVSFKDLKGQEQGHSFNPPPRQGGSAGHSGLSMLIGDDAPPDESWRIHDVWRGPLFLPLSGVERNEEPGQRPELRLTGPGDSLRCIPEPTELGPELGDAIMLVLAEAVRHEDEDDDGLGADWTGVREALGIARRRATEDREVVEMTRLCTVWEVQRNWGKTWITPFMPAPLKKGGVEVQKAKWMDHGLMKPHPLLNPDISEAEWGASKEPPLVLPKIWKPKKDEDGVELKWEYVMGPDTSEKGYQYAGGFNAQSWIRHPRPVFDVVRRRKWQREYVAA